MSFTSCRDDKNGAIYKIIIEQSGEHTAYKKYLILVASGGLFDEINQKHISTPILEDKYFENERICLITNQKIDMFMATLSINQKRTDIQNDFKAKLTVFKNDKIVHEQTLVYTPQMQYPQTIRINPARKSK